MISRCALIAVALALLTLPLPAFSQTVTFTSDFLTQNKRTINLADFNNDGRDDLITFCEDANGRQQIAINLSRGDSIYDPADCYSLPNQYTGFTAAIGDFNKDGNLDFVVEGISPNESTKLFEYLNNGKGQFHLQTSLTTKTQIGGIVAADINHDGNIDLVAESTENQDLYTYFGNGKGAFSAGPTSTVNAEGFLQIGDFDGDGKVDLLTESVAFTTDFQIAYGDGQGHFHATGVHTGDVFYHVFDVNGDGRSDLIGTPFDFSTNGSIYHNSISVRYGNANRTFTAQSIPLSNCNVGNNEPVVADFDGDGIPDILMEEASDCQGDGPFTINVLLGQGNRNFQSEQAVYTFTKDTMDGMSAGLTVARLNHDTKPDFVLSGEKTNSTQGVTILFTNTTSGGHFAGCSAPDQAVGFNLCSPTSTVSSSTSVKFSIGAGNQTPGRKVEVWIDGKKAAENLKGFSNYSFFDKTLTLAPGTHHVGIFSSGWDNLTQQYDWTGGPGVTFPLTVKSTKCPANTGLMVCSPLNDSTLGSSVHAWAAGKLNGTTVMRMEVWVDGVKKFTSHNSNTLDTHLSLAAGTHKFTYFLVGQNGAKTSETVNATVK